MTVKELKAIIADMSDEFDDLPVFVPVGMDWKEALQIRVEGIVDLRGNGYFTPRVGSPHRALMIRPYLGEH